MRSFWVVGLGWWDARPLDVPVLKVRQFEVVFAAEHGFYVVLVGCSPIMISLTRKQHGMSTSLVISMVEYLQFLFWGMSRCSMVH